MAAIPAEIGVYTEDGRVLIEIGPIDGDGPVTEFSLEPEFARQLARLLTLASFQVEDDEPEAAGEWPR